MTNSIVQNSSFTRLILAIILINCVVICQNTYIPDDNFEESLIELGFDDILDDSVLTENIDGVNELYIIDKGIGDLTGIQDFKSLTKFNCQNNKLTSLDMSGNTALTWLNCENNKLTSIDVKNNKVLTWLNCENNKLTSIDVRGNTALTSLECHSNKLTNIDLRSNTALIELECHSNKFTSLDISKNKTLKWLKCFNNKLTSLDVSNNPNLSYLDCNNNKLTSLDVSNNPNLTELYINNNKLNYLKMKNQYSISLRSLNAIDNSNLKCIEVLDPKKANTKWNYKNGSLDEYVTFAVICGSEAVTNWYVSNFGTDITGNGTQTNPFYSIQVAINSATDGDTITVDVGTYSISVTQDTKVDNINYNSKNIVLLGSSLIKGSESEYEAIPVKKNLSKKNFNWLNIILWFITILICLIVIIIWIKYYKLH